MRNSPIVKVVLRSQFFCTLLVLVLAGCQSSKSISINDSSSKLDWISGNDNPLLRIEKNPETWRYLAKVGIKTESLSEQANMVWAYRDQANDVRLFGPFGAGAVKLEFDQYGVQLNDGKGVLHRGSNAEALLADLVGWPIPIDSLRYWLLANAAPQSAYLYSLDQIGQVSKIQQLGWEISYSDYREYGARKLPRKVTAVKDFGDADHGEVTVKLVAKAWSFGVVD